jgi:DNA modification methylase
MKNVKLMQGDNILSLKKLPDNSVDSVVTDPPYALNFMNKKWDAEVPSVDFWKEVYRVLKPGGHVLSFGGTRTYHRMTVNIEDAGFEIRDQIMWLYGSGFPKSHNIGKSVDKIQGNEREVVGKLENYQDKRGLNGQANVGENAKPRIDMDITKGTSEWEGWGTALKPANEPICVARKPLSESTIAKNVLKWGTGGINIDGCRVESNNNEHHRPTMNKMGNFNNGVDKTWEPTNAEGRFPANIILDEEAGRVLDKQSGIGASRFFYQAKVGKKERSMGLEPIGTFTSRPKREDGSIIYKDTHPEEWEEAMKSRPTKDKNILASSVMKLQTQNTSLKNTHPTVKPVSLMAYLVRLVTPPNGIVLDPFMGSGSTGIATRLEGFRFCGMEMDEDYFKIASSRIDNFESYREFLKK